MIDLNILEPYIEEPNEDNNSYADVMILDCGFDTWFENQLNIWINCSYISINGNRIIQTNDKRYNHEITTILCMIEKYVEEDRRDYYYKELLNQHNKNLEFESINGFAYDPYAVKSKKSSNSSRKKSKQTSIDFGDKPKKETVAERKLKAHVAKINSFKITLKPVKNDNTI